MQPDGAGAANDATVTTDIQPPGVGQLQVAHTEAVSAAEGARRKLGKLQAFVADAQAEVDKTAEAVEHAAAAVVAETERVRLMVDGAAQRLTGAGGGA